MNTLIKYFSILLLAFGLPAAAQTAQRILIGKTGLTLNSPCRMKFDVSLSKDSSTVYNSECTSGGITYGVICVKLLNPRTDLDDAETLTAAYLDYLQSSFNITHAEGYEKGLRLNKDEKTRGISDNWSDANQLKWKVKGWTNGSFLVVLYASTQKMFTAAVDAYLNSLRFR